MKMPLVLTLLLLLSPLVLAAGKDISVQEAYQLSSGGEVLLVDVRALQEWRQTGIAPTAVTITMHQPDGLAGFTAQLLQVVNGNKEAPIALICAGGVRSSRVQDYLQQQGFTQVSNVREGMIGSWFSAGWIEQGLPVKAYIDQ